MDQKVVIKEEQLWLEETGSISFERVELESAVGDLKEEARPELTEPGLSQPASYVKEEVTIEEHTTEQLVQHIKEENRVENIAVDTCEVLKTGSELTCNLPPDNVYHQELLSPSMGEPNHPNECGMKENLTEHLTDTGDRLLCCSECGKTFRSKGNLTRHLHTHNYTEEHLHKCNECGKAFHTKKYLHQHLRTHGERAYHCNECGKKVQSEGHLKQHLLTHTRERMHVCNVCDRTFLMKANLNVHMTTHAGERPLSCYKCGRCFRSKSLLTEHMPTHTNDFYLLYN